MIVIIQHSHRETFSEEERAQFRQFAKDYGNPIMHVVYAKESQPHIRKASAFVRGWVIVDATRPSFDIPAKDVIVFILTTPDHYDYPIDKEKL